MNSQMKSRQLLSALVIALGVADCAQKPTVKSASRFMVPVSCSMLGTTMTGTTHRADI